MPQIKRKPMIRKRIEKVLRLYSSATSEPKYGSLCVITRDGYGVELTWDGISAQSVDLKLTWNQMLQLIEGLEDIRADGE
jgi:hypothetical protein